MFATFQSVSVFIVLTVAVLTIFASDETVVALSYVVAAASITAMFLGFKMSSTAEPLVYVGRNPSAVYRLFRLTLLTTLALTPIPVAAGLLMLTPGVIAYRLESYVTVIDEHYPTFIKALGENMASTSDLKAALEYVLHMELGPLRSLASRASARLKLGVAGETAFSLLASEAG